MAEKTKLPDNIKKFPTRRDYIEEYTDEVFKYMDSLPPRDVAKSISIFCIQSSRANMPQGKALDDAINFWRSPEMIAYITDLVRRKGAKGAVAYLADLPQHLEEELQRENEFKMEPLAPKVDASGRVVHEVAEKNVSISGDGVVVEEEVDGTEISSVLSNDDFNDIMGY